MRCADLPIPGLFWGDYPERQPAAAEPQTRRFPAALKVLGDRAQGLLSNTPPLLLSAFSGQRKAFRRLGPAQFREAVRTLRLQLQTDGMRDTHLASAFALVGVACEREHQVRIFDTQVIAAWIVLGNRLAEMATGEGKTYAVALAAATAALAGIPVHVVTANDYLVARDADLLRPVYAALGLAVGAVIQGQQAGERRAAYACDITCCTARELVFDYLRDGLGRTRDPLRRRVDQLSGEGSSPPLLRGLCMAIVDEADSILIDEARVPFILAQAVGNEQETDYLKQSLEIARQLGSAVDSPHFRLDPAARTARLTLSGQERADALVRPLASVWRNRLHREESIRSALAALHIYRRDRHYLVRDGKMLIIDDTTGRVAPGRAWSRGLHQLIELKEQCLPTAAQVTAAQITYQRFFPRYLRLAGLSGTLSESAGELRAHYDLAVSCVPLRRPNRRTVLPSRLFANRQLLQEAIACRVVEFQHSGRPVLIGTDSVADSEALSQLLEQRGVAHALLNARNDLAEAKIVARAGERGAITVATNMAGRGVDITLGKGVSELGGLHVICCQFNAARRIDRQLAGRCARQGDPGSVETWLTADASLFVTALGGGTRRLLAAHAAALPSRVVHALAALVQRRIERRHVLERKRLLQHDQSMDRRLSFGGPLE